MRKILSLFAAVLFAGSMWATPTVLYTLDATDSSNQTDNNGYAGTGTVTVGVVTWSVGGNGQITPWRIGGKNLTGVDRVVKTTTAYSNALTSIDLTIGNASSVTINSITLTHSTNANFSDGTTINATSKAPNSTITFAPTGGFPANSYYKFTFNITISVNSNKFVEFKKVEFYGEAPTTPEISCLSALDFGIIYGNTLSASKELEISAANLTQNISAALETGTSFALPSASVDKDGGNLTINFTPAASGNYSDKLTLSSGSTSKEVTLSGKAVKTTHAGTNADPFDVADTRAIAFAHADDATTSDSISVKGQFIRVTSASTTSGLSFSIGVGEDTVLCYGTKDAEGNKTLTTSTFKAGDVAIVRGKLKNYKSGDNNIAEMYYGHLIDIINTDPKLTATPTSLDFETVGQNDAVAAKTFTLTGLNLTDANAVTIVAPDGFTVSPTSVTPVDGSVSQVVTVTPVTSTLGTFDDPIIISTEDLTDDVEVAVSMEVAAKYTVSFSTGAGNPTQADIAETIVGQGITLPDGPAPACTNWTFAGWKETSAVAEETTTAPTLLAAGANFKPTADCTLYAVYKRTEGASAINGNTTVTESVLGLTGSYADGVDKGDYKWSFSDLMKNTGSIQGNGSKPSILWNTVEFPAAISKVEIVISKTSGPTSTSELCFGSSVKPTNNKVALGAGSTYSLSTAGTLTITSDIPANSTYVTLSWTSGASYYESIKVYYGNAGTTYYISAPACDPTALDNAAVEGKAVKFIENGQLFIEKAGVRYNVMGQIMK